ncbi:DUF3592 domain-containing protein [Reinekea marinisedimentorum]|uniref:Uncharacterized protein DUF3592 n=1 Tax=Reinekea marinisedimentorum TaxID=230495 RepID=A0A4R3HWU7_9GAMM|nr:DUF3592 domain-containing protein [Reinekea marinisedimentorum]TCS35879.1 uncharacterized protein DUF3592 [Reinekea marinisedimentorum]
MEIQFVPLVAGGIFAGLGVFMVYDYYRFNKSAIKAQGEILRYDEYQSKDSDNRKRTMYCPYFVFAVGGKAYEVKSNTSYSSKAIPVGEKVDVLYQPGNEAKARLAKGNDSWLGILFIGLSLPAFYYGLF